jgi:PAS domain S-box-containing protein
VTGDDSREARGDTPRPAEVTGLRITDERARANLSDIRMRFGETQLEAIVDLAIDWLWETDEAHRWTWVSDRCEAFTGVPASALLGRSSIHALTRKAAANPAVAAHLSRIAAHQPFRDVLLELRNGSSSCRWIAVSGVPFFDANGRFAGYRGMTRNVTAMVDAGGDPVGYEANDLLRRAADAETVAAAERMRSAMDYVPDAMVAYDGAGRIQFYNEALLTIYRDLEDVIRPGITMADIVDVGLARGIFDLDGASPEEWRSAFLDRATVNGSSSVTFRFADGRWVMHREYLSPGGGRVGICTDISELKEKEAAAERARAEAEAAKTRLQSAIDAMEDSFVLWDSDDRLVACNASYRQQFDMLPWMELGCTSAELLDMLCESAANPETARRDLEGLARQISARRPEADTETVELLADGRWILSRDQITPIGDRLAIRTDITEMKAREARLAEANAVMRAILRDVQGALDAMNMGVLLLDPELRVETMNRAFRRLWKLGDGEAPAGTPMRDVFDLPSVRALYGLPAKEEDAYFDARTQAMRTGNAASGELRRADGSTLQFSMTRLSSGKQLVCHYDVTALKDREAALEGALERAGLVEAALDSVSDPVFLKDADLRFVFTNAAFDRLAGVPAGSLIGKRNIDVFDRRWAEPAERREREVLATRESLEFEDDPDRHRDGRFRIVRKDVVEVGGKRFIAGFVIDVTEIRRREQEAEEARRRLANVLNTLPAGVVIFDEQDRFVLCNERLIESVPKIAHLLVPGVTLRSVLEAAHKVGYFNYPGEPEMERLYADDPQAWIEATLHHYRHTHPVRERQNRNGTWHQVYDVRTSDGYFVGVRVDISELKAREAALREAERRAVLADRAKSEFLANMSHEIRTPMNGVLGMAELLSKTQLDIKQKTFTDIIVKSGNALLTIINDILDFSKIDAGQLVLDPMPFDLAESVEDVATLMSMRAKEKELELIVRIDPTLPRTMVGDGGRLRQIVTNLVGNAVKFTDCGHVLVSVVGSVEDGTARLRFEVEDTGIGIPADMIDQVFEKFSQVDGSSTRRHEGTGLGLAITSRLVALMGGRIGVESEIGVGSRFWFEIDLPVGEGAGRVVFPAVDVTGARVLVIDDNAVNRAILMEQLTSWGFDACAARHGREGLAVMHEAVRLGLKVDCVVLDYQMPGMSGAEVAAQIRATPSIAQTPIIMLTSVDQPLSGMENRQLAIAMQLIKPVRSAALLEGLSATMQRRAARPQPEEIVQLPSISMDIAAAPQSAADGRDAAGPATGDEDWSGWNDGRVDILVAEDNEVNQLVFAQILGETGHTFEIVSNGELAVIAWRTLRPSLVLMDVSMPQMNGLEATEAIRAEEAGGPRVPIVGVTAHALKGDRERCLDAGMDDYLPKPISPKALRGVIARWLSDDAEERASA